MRKKGGGTVPDLGNHLVDRCPVYQFGVRTPMGEGGGPGPDLGNQHDNRHGRVNVNPGCMFTGGEGGAPDP